MSQSHWIQSKRFAPPFDHTNYEVGKDSDWGALFASRPLPELDAQGARIAIVGAGIAGMVAAYELSRRNFSVKVFERESTVGGRIRTHHFNERAYGELGAMRIPSAHTCVLDYARCFGLSIREFANWNPNGAFHLNGVRGTLRQPGDIYGSFDVRSKGVFPNLGVLRGNTTGGTAEILFSTLNTGLDSLRQTVDLLEILNAHDSYSPHPALTQTLRDFALSELVGLSEDDWLILSRLGGAAPLAECCLQQFILDMLPIFRSPMFEIVGGMDLLAESMAAALPKDSILLSAEIHEIRRTNSELIVSYQLDNKTHCDIADYVLITSPPAHISKIRMVGLPAAKRMAEDIARVQVRPLFKCLAFCERQFWSADSEMRDGGLLPTDTALTQVWHPSPLANNNCVITAAYAFASHASTWEHIKTASEVRKLIFGGLQKVHCNVEDLENTILDISYKYWNNGYTYLEPTTYHNLLHSAKTAGSLDEGVVFAGEHMGPMHGWIVSAAMPAQFAVESIIQRHRHFQSVSGPSIT